MSVAYQDYKSLMWASSYKGLFLFLFRTVKGLPVAFSLGVVPFCSLLFSLLQNVVPPNCWRSSEALLGFCCRSVEVEPPGKIEGSFTFLLWRLENCPETDQICSAQCGHSWDRVKDLTSCKRQIRPTAYTKTLMVSWIWRRRSSKGQSPVTPCCLNALCTVSDMSESWMVSNFLALFNLQIFIELFIPLGSSFQHLTVRAVSRDGSFKSHPIPERKSGHGSK